LIFATAPGLKGRIIHALNSEGVMKEQSSAAPAFKVHSYIGSEIADFDPERKERPPRTAKLVVGGDWSWSPAHSRSARYFLCTNRARSCWILWEEGFDDNTGKELYARVAFGYPYRGVPPKTAAEYLLRETWKDGATVYDQEIGGFCVAEPGLLDAADVERIEEELEEDIEKELNES
jgi:hypothetical protein